ncbi:MAG: FkbM family methyltransferase, partial [Methanothermobacter tenebrarum]
KGHYKEGIVNFGIRIGSAFLDVLSYLPYFKGKGLLALWALRLFGSAQPLTMRLPNGSRIWVSNDNVGHMLLPYSIGKYEKEFTRLFLYYLGRLQPGESVVDLGANVGYYAIMAAYHLRHFQGSVVYAFEPNPLVFDYLQRNKELNHLSNLTAVQQAAAEKNGTMTLYINPGGITFGSLRPYLLHLTDSCEVQVTTLDEFLAQYPESRIGLMKLDIEGAELLALRGAWKTIERYRPIIFYEENESAYQAFGYTVTEVRSFLERLGYRFYIMKPTDVQNVIALPEGR